jgi:hypothetical protein
MSFGCFKKHPSPHVFGRGCFSLSFSLFTMLFFALSFELSALSCCVAALLQRTPFTLLRMGRRAFSFTLCAMRSALCHLRLGGLA